VLEFDINYGFWLLVFGENERAKIDGFRLLVFGENGGAKIRVVGESYPLKKIGLSKLKRV
jgi:hypothetical protein